MVVCAHENAPLCATVVRWRGIGHFPVAILRDVASFSPVLRIDNTGTKPYRQSPQLLVEVAIPTGITSGSAYGNGISLQATISRNAASPRQVSN